MNQTRAARSFTANFRVRFLKPALAAAAFLAAALIGGNARAQDAWATTPQSNLFNGLNWTSGSTPGATNATIASGASLYFGSSSITSLTNNEASFTFAGFTFNSGAAAFTIGGNSFTLTRGITNNSTALETINNNITLSGTETIAGGGNIALGGNLSSTGGFSLTGTGTLVLSGNNTYSGVTGLDLGQNVSNSTLQLVGSSAMTDSVLQMRGSNSSATTQTVQFRGNGNTTFAMGSSTTSPSGAGTVAYNIFLDNYNYQNNTYIMDVGAKSGGSAGVMTVGTVAFSGYYNGTNYQPTLNATNANSDGSGLTITSLVSGGITGGQEGNLLTINSAISNTNGLVIGSFDGSDSPNSSILTLTGAGNTTFAGSVSAAVGLTVVDNQTGTVTLAGSDSFGTLNLNAGTLVLANNSALASSGAQTVGSSANNAVSVLIGGPGYLTGGVTISNNFTATDADSAALTFGGGNTSGTNTFSGTIQLGGGTNGKNITVLSATGGEIAFIGNILKSGSSTAGITVGNGTNLGTVLLSGANTYTGTTSVNDGTLILGGTSSNVTATTVSSGATLKVIGTTGTGAVTINGGATLAGTGTIGGAVSVAGGTSGTGGTINLSNSANTTLAIYGGLTLGGTGGNYSNLVYGLNSTGPELIALGTGTLTLGAGGADITVNYLGSSASGTYNLISYTGSSGVTTGSGATVGDLTLTDPTIVFGVTGSLTVTGSAVELVTTASATPTIAYWKGSQGSLWNSNNGAVGNFTTDSAGVTGVTALPSKTTDVYFSATGATNLSNNLGQSFDIKGLTFLSGFGAVSISDSTSSLTLEGDGLTDNNGNGVTLNPTSLVADISQTWTNSSSGTLTISAPVSTTTNTTLTLSNTSSGSTLLNGLISNGTGTLSLTVNSSGSGAAILGAANTFTGPTTITAGSLQLGTNNALQDSTVAINATNGLLFSGGVGSFNIGALGGTANETLTDTSMSGVALNVGADNATTTYSGNLSGTGGSLTKSGSGTLTLSGNNSYTGSTSVSAGTLVLSGTNTITGPVAVNAGILNLQSSGGLGAASSVTVTNNAALQLQGGISETSAAPLTLNGSGISSNGALENVSGNNTYSGIVTLGSATTIGSDSNSLTLSNATTIGGSGDNLTLAGAGNGTIDGGIGTGSGGLTMNGTGTWTLAGNNSYTGATTLNSGTLILSGINTATGVTTINGSQSAVNGTLQLIGANALQGSALAMRGGNPFAVTETLQLHGNGNTTFNMGSSTAAPSGTATVPAYNIFLDNYNLQNNTFTFDVGASSGGSEGVMTVGTVDFSGYSGGPDQGTLNATNSNNDGSGLTITAIQSSNTNINGQVANLLTINSSISNTNGFNIGSFTGANNFASTLTLTGAGNTTFTGAVANGTGQSLTLTDNQTGTVTLAGSDSFNGGSFALNAGTLVLDNNSALGAVTTQTIGSSGSNNVSVLLGDSSHYTGGLTVAQNFTAQNADTGTLTLGGQNTSGTNTFSGNITLGATTNTGKNITLLSATGGQVNFAGNILANGTSTAGVTVGNRSNAGTVVLSGTNTYIGATTVGAGTLTIGGSGTLGSGSYAGAISNSSSFIYNSSSAQTLSGQITGTGALTQSGSGTLTLSGNNSYTGSTAVSAGMLLVNGNQSSATGAVSVASGATLGGTGIIGGAATVAGGGTINVSNSTTQTLTINGGLTVGDPVSGASNLNFVAGLRKCVLDSTRRGHVHCQFRRRRHHHYESRTFGGPKL
jgi:autotransporter-associated beta strand protein